MDSFSLYQRALSVALRMTGSEARLARQLQVPLGELQRWLAGREPIPKWLFLAAVDVIAEPEPEARGGTPAARKPLRRGDR